ncbi:HD-GYP domain-containing protein [Calycomorphotria hydatis]|uniref:HD-GYP domain-containing protein n=1 Tax=Calycomorphotria hydatis TaxID=2528027 RepID=UPI0018D254C7|nr:HD domain-containing phosphohydrolase [Calycomorphotria hydatis]
MKLPVQILDEDSRLLLNQGSLLSSYQLEQLQSRGLKAVQIDSRHAAAITGGASARIRRAESVSKSQRQSRSVDGREFPADSFIHSINRSKGSSDPNIVARFKESIVEAEVMVEQLFEEIDQASSISGAQVHAVTSNTADQLAKDMDLFVRLGIEVGETEDTISQHGIRVTRLAMATGVVAGLNRDKLMNLGMGCLISDAGMQVLKERHQDLPRRLTSMEFLEITKHPAKTFDMLYDSREIPPDARTIAYQMHERWNGSGYPRGRTGRQIHPLARIAMVADVYVALISTRPYRPAYSAPDAMRILLEETSRGLFEPESTRALLETISLHPVGTIVSLTNGRIARVVSANMNDYSKPIVESFDVQQGAWSNELLDLMSKEDLQVSRLHASLEAALESARQAEVNTDLAIKQLLN